MSLMLQYIDHVMRNMGYEKYHWEAVTIEKMKDNNDTVIEAYNEYYFLNSFFFPAGTEKFYFAIYSDNEFDEFTHQANYSGLSELLTTFFYTGKITLTTYETYEVEYPFYPVSIKNPVIKANMFLFNFIRVIPQV